MQRVSAVSSCACCLRSWGYRYVEESYYAWSATRPPPAGQMGEEQLAAQLRKVLEELAAVRRELDEIRRSKAREHRATGIGWPDV